MAEEQDNQIERRDPGGISRRSETARRGSDAARFVEGLAKCTTTASRPTQSHTDTVSGTIWRFQLLGINPENTTREFRSDGYVRTFDDRFVGDKYSSNSPENPEVTQNSVWEQEGATVRIYINQYSTYEGTLLGNHMSGRAFNAEGESWTWEATKMENS